jgi:heptosyltransferase I
VISPAASKDERNWLPERYAQFADYAVGKGYQVVLCGSPAAREKTLAARIIAAANAPLVNLVGQTSLKQLAAVLARADAVLAPDSGPAHMATTQGTPVLGLYGHSNPKRTGPYNNLADVVSVYETFAEQQHGKPVNQLAWSTRVKGDHVMAAIDTQQVIDAFETMMAKQYH